MYVCIYMHIYSESWCVGALYMSIRMHTPTHTCIQRHTKNTIIPVSASNRAFILRNLAPNNLVKSSGPAPGTTAAKSSIVSTSSSVASPAPEFLGFISEPRYARLLRDADFLSGMDLNRGSSGAVFPALFVNICGFRDADFLKGRGADLES